MVLCNSVNAGSVVGIPWCGKDTQTIPYTKEFMWTIHTHPHKPLQDFNMLRKASMGYDRSSWTSW